ncbi:MAG: GNAT family N-acetyltransferase [Bacteroidales bacterium]|nr:GNAT family N-acetyltransferase [Bacteroidales bacterium]
MQIDAFLISSIKRRLHQRKNKQVHFTLEDKNYIIKLAETSEEVDAALRLRFEVFNLEMKEGLESSYATMRDEDMYDKQFDHLLIIDKASQKIIGTYRMQTYEMAKKGIGFYSNGEFCLDMLPKHIISESIELGRACIDKNFRNTRVLFLLWRGIANYIHLSKKRYLFGCCSLTSQEPLEGLSLLKQLREGNQVDTTFKMTARPGYELDNIENLDSLAVQVEMPPLLGMYLRYGAKIIGDPAIDREFKTIDYLILLDVSLFDQNTFRLFLGKQE